jgi:hypothetical protein
MIPPAAITVILVGIVELILAGIALGTMWLLGGVVEKLEKKTGHKRPGGKA